MPGSVPDKPIDLGTGTIAASFAADGSWLSVGCLHPAVGFVELAANPPFDEASRGDPVAVRQYRARLSEPDLAFLVIETGPNHGRPFLTPSTAAPDRITWYRPGGAVVMAEAQGRLDARSMTQRWQFTRLDGEINVRIVARLDRPALAEITEVSPLASTNARTIVQALGRRVAIRARALPATATVDVSEGSWILLGDDSAQGGAVLHLPPGDRVLTISVALTPGSETETIGVARQATVDHRSPGNAAAAVEVRSHGDSADAANRLTSRAIAYVRGCTALRFATDERAIVTDHRLLPLSWTRDAYFQTLLLLAADGDGDRTRVADHLRWLWRRCLRPDGRWARSHHANGEPKDLAFQADQQLFPFVELADYWRLIGRLPEGVDWADAVPVAWKATLSAVDPAVGLISSDENAADDRAELPFIASSQILLWYTATRLAEPGLASAAGLTPANLAATAAGVRHAFWRHLAVGGRWAYATDGRGRTLSYHDANDMPTAIAPLWGFCPADDPAWRATIAFAFSEANPAFVPGPWGGLGSGHTPGSWPLGDVQAWLVARAIGDDAGADHAMRRLEAAAFADGMLPEAVVMGSDGPTRTRQWFAWPGAALGSFSLLDRTGRLASIVGTRTGDAKPSRATRTSPPVA